MHRLPALLWEKHWQRDKYREKDLLSCLCKGAGFFMGQFFFLKGTLGKSGQKEKTILCFFKLAANL